MRRENKVIRYTYIRTGIVGNTPLFLQALSNENKAIAG